MKHFHTIAYFAIVVATASCTNVKNIYNSDYVNERQYDKLVKMYLKNTRDTSISNRLVYAYNALLNDQLGNIERLRRNNSLQATESLIYAYDDLQSLYNSAAPIASLVHPGDTYTDRQLAVQTATEAWYRYGQELLQQNDWHAGREALGVLNKVNRWTPGFRDSRPMMETAREMGTIDAVIQPLRTEGFFYASSYTPATRYFSDQLVSDMAPAWQQGAMYRAYNAADANNRQLAADWLVEPVIAKFYIDPVHLVRSTRTVTKSIEVGKDSLKAPIYKSISAELQITEASVCSGTNMEARISDLVNRRPVDSRLFQESITLREVYGSFTGDRRALSTEDWAIVNNRNRPDPDERWLQDKMLEKIYPQMLQYLRERMR